MSFNSVFIPETGFVSCTSELIVGDCVSAMAAMDANTVDFILTSPPYDDLREYQGYSFDFSAIARGMYRVLREGGVAVWVVGDRLKGGRSLTSFRQAIQFQDMGFCVHDVMIYSKLNTPFIRIGAYTPAWEFMFVLSKGKPKAFNPIKEPTVVHSKGARPHNTGADGVRRYRGYIERNPTKVMTNVWEFSTGLGGTTSDRIAFEHPAIFPEKLAVNHILSWTNAGDTVMDPMCGSGTTGKAALQNGRSFIGIDISPDYISLTDKRLLSHNLVSNIRVLDE